MKYSIYYFIGILFIIYFTIGINQKKYYNFYPTIPIYPDNNIEIKLVKLYRLNINRQIYNLYYLTDTTQVNEFIKIVPNENKNYINKIIKKYTLLIYILKYIFNRARPKQVDPTINALYSNTSNTPAFPSGHSLQSFYLAKILSNKYPKKKKELYNLANNIGYSRIYAGLHYPSDHLFSKFIANILP